MGELGGARDADSRAPAPGYSDNGIRSACNSSKASLHWVETRRKCHVAGRTLGLVVKRVLRGSEHMGSGCHTGSILALPESWFFLHSQGKLEQRAAGFQGLTQGHCGCKERRQMEDFSQLGPRSSLPTFEKS